MFRKEKRNSLEELSWEAVLEAIKFAEAQEDPELRLLAMRVASSIMRTELAVLHDQDQAAVDELVEEVEGDRGELAKKTQEDTRKSRREETEDISEKPEAAGIHPFSGGSWVSRSGIGLLRTLPSRGVVNFQV